MSKWIIRLTAVSSIISMVFWCIWSVFATLPHTSPLNLWLFKVPALARASDFAGLLIMGFLLWDMSRSKRLDGWDKIALVTIIGGIGLLGGLDIGFLPAGLALGILYTIGKSVLIVLVWSYQTICELVRDCHEAFSRKPKVQ